MSAVLTRGIVPVPVSLAIPTLHALPEASKARTPLVPVPVSPRSRETSREARAGYALAGEAGAAYDDLHHALLLAKERGQEVPCRAVDSGAWTSDDADDQERAADRCLDCPAMLLCAAYADLAGETSGVWGGAVRETSRKARRASSVRESKERRRKGLAPKRAAPATRPPAKNARPCACGCGGMTRGGRYLPGHDSQHAAQLLAAVRSGAVTRADALDALAESPILRAKFSTWLG